MKKIILALLLVGYASSSMAVDYISQLPENFTLRKVFHEEKSKWNFFKKNPTLSACHKLNSKVENLLKFSDSFNGSRESVSMLEGALLLPAILAMGHELEMLVEKILPTSSKEERIEQLSALIDLAKR